MVKHLPTMQETWVQSLVWEDLLEKEMATHSSILAWRIPRTEEPHRLQSMELQSRLSDFTFTFHLGCPWGWALIQSDQCPYDRRRFRHTHRGRPSEDTGKDSHLEPRREAPGETSPVSTLILDFQPPELWGIDFCCLDTPVYGALFVSSRVDQDNSLQSSRCGKREGPRPSVSSSASLSWWCHHLAGFYQQAEPRHSPGSGFCLLSGPGEKLVSCLRYAGHG